MRNKEGGGGEGGKGDGALEQRKEERLSRGWQWLCLPLSGYRSEGSWVGSRVNFFPTTWHSLPITVSRQVRCGERVDQGQQT